MRHLILFFVTLAIANFTFAQNTEINKSYFISAKHNIENMLNGKEQPNYEKAIFIIENAFYENSIDKQSFDFAMQNHINSINEIIKTNYNFNATNPEPSLRISKEQLEQQYKKALTNYAIYTYMTSNIGFVDSQAILYHKKYDYSFSDPMASNNWENTQVTNLNNTQNGNCFALASLFKILSNRLNSEASLCTAPSHIYISHKDNLGINYNVELGSKNFVGTGTLSTLTHSSPQSIQNKIALRQLNEKQSVALCLVYLAKGYEHKFKNVDDNFILQCAETTIKYDDKNLNALLLKAEYLENKLTAQQKTITQLQTQNEFKEYQTLIVNLYNLGYREIPFQMKNQLIKGWSRDTITKLANETYARSDANLKKQIQTRQASLSWGLFDENFTEKPTERIGNTLFNTKSKRIISFAKEQYLYNNYNFDPVVFAWNIDPLYKKYASLSPYAFCANTPIRAADLDGRELRLMGHSKDLMGFQTAINVASNNQIQLNINEAGMATLSIVGDQKLSEKNQKFYDAFNEVVDNEKITNVLIIGKKIGSRDIVTFGSFNNFGHPNLDKPYGAIDFEDLKSLDKSTNGELSLLGTTIHEVYENFYKQVTNTNASYNESHDAATNVQEGVDGITNFDSSFEGSIEKDETGRVTSINGTAKFSYNDASGKKTTVSIPVKSGNPVPKTKTTKE